MNDPTPFERGQQDAKVRNSPAEDTREYLDGWEAGLRVVADQYYDRMSDIEYEIGELDNDEGYD